MTVIGIITMNHTQNLRLQLLEEQLDANCKKREPHKQHMHAVCQQLRNLLGAECYSTWWETAPETGFLETAEAKLLGLLQKKWRLCTGKLYRGVFLWHDADGFYLIRECGQIVPFVNEGEARGYVDATFIMAGSLI